MMDTRKQEARWHLLEALTLLRAEETVPRQGGLSMTSGHYAMVGHLQRALLLLTGVEHIVGDSRDARWPFSH